MIRSRKQNLDLYPGVVTYDSDDCEEFFGRMDSDPATKRWYQFQMRQELKRCNVIFTTNSLAGAQGMTDIYPHYVIMDESGATPEYETFVIAARNPDTLLLVGGFMQLPPVIVSEKIKKYIGTSLMERLWHNTAVPRRQLIYQYRFDRQFEEFLNEFIYNEQSGMLPIDTDPNWHRTVVRQGISIAMPVAIIDSSSTICGGGNLMRYIRGMKIGQRRSW